MAIAVSSPHEQGELAFCSRVLPVLISMPQNKDQLHDAGRLGMKTVRTGKGRKNAFDQQLVVRESQSTDYPKVEQVFYVQIWRQNLFVSKFRQRSKIEVELSVCISFSPLYIGVLK
jgi:hypothetical protein